MEMTKGKVKVSQSRDWMNNRSFLAQHKKCDGDFAGKNTAIGNCAQL
jgi:hypothetical protein